jgi:hypothetical protein
VSIQSVLVNYYGTLTENDITPGHSYALWQALSSNRIRTTVISSQPTHIGWIHKVPGRRLRPFTVQLNTEKDGITYLKEPIEHENLTDLEAIKLADEYFGRKVVLDNPINVEFGYRILARPPQDVMDAACKLIIFRHI